MQPLFRRTAWSDRAPVTSQTHGTGSSGRTTPRHRAVLLLGVAIVASVATPSRGGPSRYDRKRAELVSSIRSEVVAAAPAADDVYLERALDALGRVPRERYVEPTARGRAYRKEPLRIGFGQTISDPYIVAIMTAAARLPPDANVLDVGTGSGYQAAVLGELGARVSSIEIVEPLARSAADRLRTEGYGKVEVKAGDGFGGWPEHAPFDAIIVAAGAADAPGPLLDQLKVGGRLVMPLGEGRLSEQLIVITRRGPDRFDRCSLGWTVFVPLTGRGERQRDLPGFPFQSGVELCHGVMLTIPRFILERLR